jgi:DNA-binding CsgD family transcriptional regulator
MPMVGSEPDLALLSVTEARVLRAIAAGMARGEVALALKISVHTVGHALTIAKEKLFARTIAEAVATYARLSRETPPPATRV